MSNLLKKFYFRQYFFKIIFILLIVSLTIFSAYTSPSENCFYDGKNTKKSPRIDSQDKILSPEEVIKEDIKAQNNYDLSTYFSLRITKVGSLENRNEVIVFRKKYIEYDILLDINKAELVELKQIPFYLIGNIRKMEEYLALYNQIKVYYVCINYHIKSESQYIFNGVNYLLYVLIFEKGNWLINEVSEPYLNQIIEAGYGFGTLEEEKALQIQTAKYKTDSKKVDLPIPSAPILSLIIGKNLFIQINWNYDIADYFNIYRSTTPNGPWEKIISNFPKIAHTAVDYNYPKNIEVLYYRITTTDKKLNESKPSKMSLIKIPQE